MEKYTLAKKQLPPGVKTHYCPYCYQSKKKQLINTKKSVFDELDSLTYFKILEVGHLKNGEEKKYIDEFWLCPLCKKRIDDKDFLKTYCVTGDNMKYTDADFNKKPSKVYNLKGGN